jgi:hypothetical protein
MLEAVNTTLESRYNTVHGCDVVKIIDRSVDHFCKQVFVDAIKSYFVFLLFEESPNKVYNQFEQVHKYHISHKNEQVFPLFCLIEHVEIFLIKIASRRDQIANKVSKDESCYQYGSANVFESCLKYIHVDFSVFGLFFFLLSVKKLANL